VIAPSLPPSLLSLLPPFTVSQSYATDPSFPPSLPPSLPPTLPPSPTGIEIEDELLPHARAAHAAFCKKEEMLSSSR